MGIQGLLPFLADSTRDAHIEQFENQFVAIDAYCWLHKGIYSCAYELAIGKPTEKYVYYCMRYIDMLLHFKVKPILVFDGRQLPSKSETEMKRREERKRKFVRGKQLMATGNVEEGKKLLGESVDVTHQMALNLIRKCREKNIDCIVAPHEADAQLAYLSLKGIVQCVITEDSDLLAYGAQRVMFKMDLTGRGKLIEKSDIHISLKMSPEEFNEDIFRYMCILSGCDYLPSLVSIGPANALKFVKMLQGKDICDVLPRLPVYLNKLKVIVTPEYIAGFQVADKTFKHHLVYDPFKRSQVPLRPVRSDDDIVGIELNPDLAFDMAVGNIDPMTMEKLCNYHPDETGSGFTILWKTDLLPNAIPRQPFGDRSLISGESHPKRENLNSNTDESAGTDLRKKCNPLKISRIRNSNTKTGTSKIPDCGFIFDPKIEKKKDISNGTAESNVLKSRYFRRKKDNERAKKQPESATDRRKDESHEEYLQRLYNEYFPLGENESEESETRKPDDNSALEKENTGLERFCTACGKDAICCTCSNEIADVSDSQMLGECVSDRGEKTKDTSPSQHFLLDEIYKSQIEKCENILMEEKHKGQKEEKVSPSQSLSLNFSKILSRITEGPKSRAEDEDSKTEVVEKENTEVLCVGEEAAVRPPSPVFKVQRGCKVLKRNCRIGNVSDTASTPTSVYFSSFDTTMQNSSSSPVSSRTSSNRRMSSVRRCNSVPAKVGKDSLKSSAVIKTLFQYGFKKRKREENETEA